MSMKDFTITELILAGLAAQTERGTPAGELSKRCRDELFRRAPVKPIETPKNET